MLVLSRKLSEKIVCYVGDVEVEFVIIRVAGNRVTVGVAAPDEVKILRGEVKPDAKEKIPA